MKDFDELFEKAEINYEEGNYQSALILFKEALTVSYSGDCLNYIACCYLNLGELVKAKSILQDLNTKNPLWERPFINLGRVNLKLGNTEEALKSFETAVKVEPDSEDAYFYLGVYYFQERNYIQAIKCYEKSLSIDSEQAEAHLNLGLCHLKLHVFDKALYEFKQAYLLDTECINAIYNQGITYYLMGNYKEALDNYLKAYDDMTDDIDVQYDIAHCYYKLNDFENSINWGQKVLNIDPAHSYANKLVSNVKLLIINKGD
ncbi:tetratricopeptide repeat protein [Paenibacillus sp. S-12]|uniref:tetratricopeptide repeat protein n=1 Tax=Paenibacillus sp. S-12 TaxID=3031371 RepID=UPI0025A0ABC1|nr:tetratricopeptide repeat protein [Paenibacillus sp. S-12]